MSKYAGTKTEKNLLAAFAGESEARNKYTYYASAAKKAGYVQMANIFEETANQEKEHAKMWFKEIHGIGTVDENLADAAEESVAGIVFCEASSLFPGNVKSIFNRLGLTVSTRKDL